MAKVTAGTTMSLDGFSNDQNGDISKLYSDFAVGHGEDAKANELLQESIRETGAAILGKNTFDMMEDPDDYARGYEYQVPIFVLCHKAPDKKPLENENLKIIFVTDGIENAIRQAKEAAGDKDVTIVGGANTAQQAINSGLVDELHIDIKPWIFGKGLRFFDNISKEIKLEKIKEIDLPERTHLRFRVVK